MIIPMHDNRFFSGCRRRSSGSPASATGIRSSCRRCAIPALEVETVNTLISYRIEYLVVAGATDPDSLSRLCASHGVAHVNVDLPGTRATSVISDNYWGAQQLTQALIERSKPVRAARRDKPYFVGGIATDYATRRRMDGFADASARTSGDRRRPGGCLRLRGRARGSRLARALSPPRRPAARAVHQLDDRAGRRRPIPEDLAGRRAHALRVRLLRLRSVRERAERFRC
jgi:DNA-binding LacI/PurR family transcriptional regulator